MSDREILMAVLGLVGCAAIVAGAVLVASAQLCAWLAQIARAIEHIDVTHEVYVDEQANDGEEWKGDGWPYA